MSRSRLSLRRWTDATSAPSPCSEIYAGVIPVFIGLLWLPFLRAVDRKWIDFFLSLTIGLLVFLGVDALEEALETAGSVPGAYQGVALVVFGLLGTPLVIGAIGRVAQAGQGRAFTAVGRRAHRLRDRTPQPRRRARHRYVLRHRRDRARHVPRGGLPASQHDRGTRYRDAARRRAAPVPGHSCCSARSRACRPCSAPGSVGLPIRRC